MINGYSIQLGKLPLDKKELEEILKVLKNECTGFITVSPQVIKGQPITFVIFKEYNDAVGAKNLFEFYGNKVGTYIMNVWISEDMKNLNVGEPVILN